MELEPRDLYEKLEFDKIITLLKEECLGELGKGKIQRLPIETQLFIIERKLNEVAELKLSIEEKDHFPIESYTDISKHLRMLEVVDYVLPEEGLVQISIILRSIQRIVQFFTTDKQAIYKSLLILFGMLLSMTN